MVWEEMEGRTEGEERDRYSKTKQKEREREQASEKNDNEEKAYLQRNNGGNAVYYLPISLYITAE